MVGSTSYSFTITNTSTDKKATNVGIYLKEATNLGEVTYPSTEGIVADWYDILTWGDAAPTDGAFVTQGATTTQFTTSLGTAAVPIALSVGTGSNLDQIGPGESVTISIQVVVPGSVSARRLYFDIEFDYQQEDA